MLHPSQAFAQSTALDADYQAVAQWLQKPAELTQLGNAHGDVAVSKTGDVYVSILGGPRAGIQVYGDDGQYIRNLSGAPNDFHGFVIHEDADGIEYIYGPRLNEPSIVKLALDGDVVMTIPADRIPQKFWKMNRRTKKPGLRLTACDVAPSGDIFVTDGYSSDLIHQFSASGEYKNTFGGREEPYRFSTLHKIAIDTRFEPARIVGVSRTDGRVVHLSLDGDYLGNVATGLLKPAALVVHGDLLAVGEILGRVTLLDKDGNITKQMGANENKDQVGTNKTEPAKWRAGVVNAPHGVAFNDNGDLFVTEYSQFGRVLRYDLQN